MKHKCIVKIQYGTYSGEETVICDEDTDTEVVHRIALKRAKCDFLPMAYTSCKIASREPIEEDDDV